MSASFHIEMSLASSLSQSAREVNMLGEGEFAHKQRGQHKIWRRCSLLHPQAERMH